MRLNYFDIFTPDNSVASIEQFAGRQSEIDQISDALQSSGTSMVIYGNRGVGKSSLAHQMVSIAENNSATISRLTHEPMKEFDFLCVQVKAEDSISDIESLLVRILRSEDALAPWLPLEIRETVGKISAGMEFGVGAAKAKVGAGKEAKLQKPTLPDDIVVTFQNACNSVIKSGVAKDGILIVVDEFDRIRDKTGFASLLKSFEGTKVRFAIVGVAQDIELLVIDHESISRQIAGGSILVKPMSDSEVRQIFEQAHQRMNSNVVFNNDAIEYITACAKGHPYIVHLLGKQALVSTVRGREARVTESVAKAALREISSQGSNVPLELEYRKAVKNSPAREFILKRFSREDKEPIRTTDIYADISSTLGIEKEAISVYMGHLCSKEYGPVLEKSGERYYRFLNSVFKAYIAARDYEVYKPS